MEKTSRGTDERKNPFLGMAHFYTGASPVCALCEANSPDTRMSGLFCVTSFRQGAAPLAPLCGYPCGLCD